MRRVTVRSRARHFVIRVSLILLNSQTCACHVWQLWNWSCMWYCRHSEWCCGRACLSPCQENGKEKVRIGWYNVCPLSIVVFVFHWRKISHHIHQKTTKILIYEQLWRGWFSSCDYTGIKCRKTSHKGYFCTVRKNKTMSRAFQPKEFEFKKCLPRFKLVVVKLSQTLSSHIFYQCQGKEKKQALDKSDTQ